MCHVDPGERGWGRDRASASKGRKSSKVKFRPAPPHTVSVSAWTGRQRGGHSAQHLRSRSGCDRLILTIGLGLRLRLQLQHQLQARRCSKKVSLASLARRLQSPNAVHALRAGSRSAAACSAAPPSHGTVPSPCALPKAPSPPSLACSSACSSEDLKLPLAQSPYRSFGAGQGRSLSKRI
jgi:hypothetical protein